MGNCDSDSCTNLFLYDEGINLEIRDNWKQEIIYETSYCSIQCLYDDMSKIKQDKPLEDSNHKSMRWLD